MLLVGSSIPVVVGHHHLRRLESLSDLVGCFWESPQSDDGESLRDVPFRGNSADPVTDTPAVASGGGEGESSGITPFALEPVPSRLVRHFLVHVGRQKAKIFSAYVIRRLCDSPTGSAEKLTQTSTGTRMVAPTPRRRRAPSLRHRQL